MALKHFRIDASSPLLNWALYRTGAFLVEFHMRSITAQLAPRSVTAMKCRPGNATACVVDDCISSEKDRGLSMHDTIFNNLESAKKNWEDM